MVNMTQRSKAIQLLEAHGHSPGMERGRNRERGKGKGERAKAKIRAGRSDRESLLDL